MEILIIAVFILGYISITMEHTLKVDKLVPALVMMVLMWTVVTVGLDGFANWFSPTESALVDGFAGFLPEQKRAMFESTLLHHFGQACEILIFLIGAMAIVEIIDHFNGFNTVKSFVHTHSKRRLLWIISILAFVLSSIIDNLTATIVLITILRKLIPENKDRMWYAGFIIIASNAGGSWTPIGDITTTMLWIGKRVTTVKLIEYLVIPSIICAFVPLIVGTFLPAFKGNTPFGEEDKEESTPIGKMMLFTGLSMIIFVPVFKSITHLPPYIGMMFSFSVMSVLAEINERRIRKQAGITDEEVKSPTAKALSRVEMPSVLFFLGILMAVAALESLGIIFNLGQDVQQVMSNELFVLLLGTASAVFDNVPLVAASMGMFSLPMDHHVWHFIAYAAGTGGSMLIIGSAAGVVAMGMEKIPFFWYLKKISWLALLGYVAGYTFMMMFHSF